MKKNPGFITILLLSSFISGCSSIGVRSDSREGFFSSGIYPGVHSDFDHFGPYAQKELGDWGGETGKILINLFLILDLPFSFILDTVCLPPDIYERSKYNKEIKRLKEEKKNKKEQQGDKLNQSENLKQEDVGALSP